MAQNRPIESRIPSKRYDMNELIYLGSWAFMRELRTHNNTKQVFDIDPYAEVYRFRDNMYGIFQENVDGGGDEWSYLIIGPEKALLIDTAFGLGNLKGLVDELTGGMPLIVVNTHFHIDHASGNAQFGSVYIHEKDVPMLEKARGKSILSEKIVKEDGSFPYVEFDLNDLIEQTDYEIIPFKDGHIFDLGGGYEVEAIHLAGHSAGQAAFLDKHDRTLFPGDDIIGMRVGIRGTMDDIKFFRDRMAYLETRMDEFDGIFPGHFIVDIESRAVTEMVKTLNAIVENPDDYDYLEQIGDRPASRCKTVIGLGCIGYTIHE